MVKQLTTILVYFLAPFCLAASNDLPKMGSSTSRVLSIMQEQKLGDDYMLQVRRFLPLEQDPLALDYIQHLGFKLVEHNPDAQDRRFYFFLVKNNALNAFALPGGYIGTHSGLIIKAQSESEVAAVLAHEVAHVTQRHLARRLEKSRQFSFPALAAMIGSIIVAAQNPEAGIGLMATTSAGVQQAIINHTRANEKEADRIGIQTLSAANFNTTAMAGFFEKIQLATRYLRKPPEFLMTHPVTQTRISDARARARELPNNELAYSQNFHLIKARLASRSQKADAQKYKQIKIKYQKNTRKSAVDQYQFALSALQNKNTDIAIQILDKLYQSNPRNLIFLVTLAEAYLANQEPKKALPLLRAELKNTPTSYPLIITYSNALLMNGQAKQARNLLLEHAHREGAEPQTLKLLAKAQEEAGFKDEVHESLGQYLYLMGDLKGALSQFDLALGRQTDDPYSITRIEARIQHIRAILKERRKRR